MAEGRVNAADDVIATLSSRVTELSKRVAMLQAELESATRRLAIYEEHDATIQDALTSALRAAYQIRERAEVAGGQILEQSREERRMLLAEIERLRDERDELQEDIAAQRRSSLAAVSRSLTNDDATEEIRAVATDALKGLFQEIVADIRGTQGYAAPPMPEAPRRDEPAPAPVLETEEHGAPATNVVEVEETPTYEAMANLKHPTLTEEEEISGPSADELAAAERAAEEQAAAELRASEERANAIRAEAERVAEELAAKERAAAEARAAEERAAQERAAEEARAAEARAADEARAAEQRAAEEHAAAERAAAQRAATERAEAEARAAQAQADADRAAAERAAAERAAAEARAAAERAAAERAAQERAATERASQERAEAELAATEARVAADRAAAERAAQERAASEARAAEERAATERSAAEAREAAERAAQERAAAERAAQERTARERAETQARAALERLAAEQAATAPPKRPPLELVPPRIETGEIAPSRVEAASPTSDIQLVLSPIGSFPRLVEIERHIQALPVVRTLYVRDFRAGVATLSVALRSSMTPEEFAGMLAGLQQPRMRLVAGSRNRLELRIEGEASIA